MDDSGQQPVLRLRQGSVSWREVDGETILLDLDRSEYLGVNASGTVLWSRLVDGTTREGLIGALQARFGVDGDRAAADVDAFLEDARKRGLLQG